jgi:hypothetical protein
MGINLFWQDENGNRLEAVLDPQMHLSQIVAAEEAVGTKLLRVIDRYGDTTFNQLQIPDLISELQEAVRWPIGADGRAHLDEVIELVRKAAGEVHTYLRFVGD